jgi:type IV secretory pathway VirB2 component (pilin)
MRYRTHLTLGRVSNLPTVWSNILCAWLLVGGDSLSSLWLLLLAGSALYTGGMYVNDYADVEFDRVHAPERPIPAGLIARHEVLLGACLLFAVGLVAAAWVSPASLGCALALLLCILAYTYVHKRSNTGPWFMAACRALLYLWVALGIQQTLGAEIAMLAAVLYSYILGLSYIARALQLRRELFYLAAATIVLPPLALALWAAQGGALALYAGLTALLCWLGYSLSLLLQSPPKIGRSIGGLLSGIIWIDLLAVLAWLPLDPLIACVFVVLFLSTRLTQKYIPAT